MGKAAEVVKRYVELYSDGTPEDYGSFRFLEIFAPDIDWVEMPTIFNPAGRKRNRETVREAVNESRKFLLNRKLEISELIEEGLVAAWMGTWSATIGIDGLEIPLGSRVRIKMATFTEVSNDLIIRQYEYLTASEII